MLQCYICHNLVEHYEYTRHVASHLAGGVTGVAPRPVRAFPSFNGGPSNYDHSGAVSSAYSAPSRSGTHNQRGQTEYDSQKTLVERSIQPNPFQTWLENYSRNFAKYTIIDGEKRNPEMEIRQNAEILRASTKEKIIKIVKAFKGFSDNRDQKTCLELVRKVPIFPGLVAYTYTHLTMCLDDERADLTRSSSQLLRLMRLVERWTKADGPLCLLSCEIVKNELLEIIHSTRTGAEDHKCNSALLNGTTVLKHDILNLAALAALCIIGEQKNIIVNKHREESENLVEILHALLESNVELEECYRTCFLNVIIPFCKEYGWCPHAFHITEGAISDLERKNEGGFGKVYRGKFDSRLVAVKALMQSKSTSSQDYTKFISKEAIVWWYLRHPNCLPLYGIYTLDSKGQDEGTALVSPWMEQGTLSDYLKLFPSANRTKLILDVVRGLNYLHTMKPHVAHRDIKPDNILITRKGNACLADFGFASVFDTTGDFHTRASKAGMCGTLHYMAPEILTAATSEERRRVNKRACDMYALGCTIYATYTENPPFYEMTLKDFLNCVTSGQRPEFPEGKMPHDMWSFVEKLWHPKRSKRLTAEMALVWMKMKASQEGIDARHEPICEREWVRKKSNRLWSVRD